MFGEIDNDKLYYKNRDFLFDHFERSDVLRGEYCSPYRVDLIKEEHVKGQEEYTDFYFRYNDYYSDYVSEVIRRNEKGEVKGYSCSCEKYKNTSSCPHLITCFRWYSDKIFYVKPDLKEVSNIIIDNFVKINKPIIKKEVFLDLEILSQGNYYNKIYSLRVKLGKDKMYTYNNKQSSFIHAIKSGENEFKFGKDFTFNFDENFLNEKSSKVFKFINRHITDLNKNYIDEIVMREFLEYLKELKVSFKYNGVNINYIKEGFPIDTSIDSLDEKNYKLDIDISDLEILCVEFAYYKGNIYYLNSEESTLVDLIIQGELDKLIIPKDKLKDFSLGILPIIKNNTNVESKLKDEIVIINEPKVSLYFDLNKSNIVVKIKLKYNEEIDYFDSKGNVLRDINFENNLINSLLLYGFVVDKNKIIMNDLEKIVNFIEEGLMDLSSKYEVFTTENFKKLNLKKDFNMSSTFSIGKDNILTYNFNLDGIESDELVNIFKSIKDKKKYYKLKNNSIIDLENSNLNEMMDLTDELDFTDEEIINGKGEILKFRAIYLDSLNKSVIKTDNLFNNFIDNFYKYKDSDIKLSTEDKKILRDYQITGVKWLYNLDKTGFGGILADEMGLGKTIELIYYIKEILKDNESSTFLIVVPTSLLYNWKYEFKKFASEIKVKLINGVKSKRVDLIENGNFNVYITTYGLLREDEVIYKEKRFHAVILDEAQNIKNPFAGITRAAKEVKSNVKFALTGTPLENSLIELWSIFDFIMPGYLSKYDKFNRKYKIHEFDENTNILLDNLSNQIKPFILRRRKKEVVKELPEKIENNIYIDLSDEQKKLYVAELDKVKEEVNKALDEGGMSKVRFMLLPLLTKLRQICIDPKIVYEDYDGGSNKIERFTEIVEEVISNGEKILVFTSFRTALNIVNEELNKKGIKTYIIDGSVSSKDRINRVDDFNEKDDVKVFLIMLKSGGTGLNLTAASTVIHLDLWWNPQAENQATDRAHRIGQKKVVEVIRLVSKGTIEEKVLELGEKKRELMTKLIDNNQMDNNILSDLTEKDIKNLLAYENK